MTEQARGTFDFVCADLTCPACGFSPEDPCAIDLQTKIASAPALQTLRTGDRIDLRDDLAGAGYLRSGDDRHDDELSVIEAWSCPSCGQAVLWARLVVSAGRLVSADSVVLDHDTLASTDYVTSEALLLIPLEEVPHALEMSPGELSAELARRAAEAT
jgi:hypothetical protein